MHVPYLYGFYLAMLFIDRIILYLCMTLCTCMPLLNAVYECMYVYMCESGRRVCGGGEGGGQASSFLGFLVWGRIIQALSGNFSSKLISHGPHVDHTH